MSRILHCDAVLRQIAQHLPNRFFGGGWGSLEAIHAVKDIKETVLTRPDLMTKLQPVDLTILQTKEKSDHRVLSASFLSPLAEHYPGILPAEAERAHFQLILPLDEAERPPMCLHMAATGDHYFWRRRNQIARPLLQQSSIGSVILENPFYGKRRPAAQSRSHLRHVSDLAVMGAALALESMAICNWLEEGGYTSFGLTGISLGGHMASIAACANPKPIALIPCLSSIFSSNVFTEGPFKSVVAWDQLHTADGLKRRQVFSSDEGPSTSSPVDSNTVLHEILEQCSDLRQYPAPKRTDACVIVIAKNDLYIPPTDSLQLKEIWPGMTVQTVPGGHLTSSLFRTAEFRQAITTAFTRLAHHTAPEPSPL